MLANMPEATDYRPMHGRSKGHDLTDGTHTRVKIDLFPEYIRHLPPQKRAVWDVVGRALCSRPVRDAFMRRLAPPLQRRFGPGYAKTGMYPIPILTRDIPGYLITPHTDTRWKGITVQLYLPRDRSNTHIGTIFHEKLADGSLPKAKQMTFAPNYRLCLCRRHRYLAFGRRGRSRGQDARQHPADLFRRRRRAARSCATAASGSAISSSAKSATGCRDRSRPGAINPALSGFSHGGGMVTRKRLRSILNALGLYVLAALLIGYFGVNAYSGNRGLKAKEDIDRQIGALIGRARPPQASSTRNGSGALRCSSPTTSTPICSTSAPARCSIMSTPTI